MRARVAIAVLLLAAAAAQAQEESPIDAAREAYGFAEWPGRREPARDGIALAEIGAPGLAVASRELRALPGGPVATIAFAGGAGVKVWVEDDPGAAQETLLEFLAGCARPLDRVEGKGAPGDVAFEARGAGEAAGDRLVAFARANVVAVVRGPAIAAQALAARIDALVAESPALGEKRPRTVPAVIELAPGASAAPRRAPIRLAARGEIVRREVRAEGGASVDEGADGGLTLRARQAGRYAVEVHLLSPRGWRARAAAEVAVE